MAEARAIVDHALGLRHERIGSPALTFRRSRAGYRASGVLLHVTSLPSPYGIGDLGPAAFAWVDRLHEAGQRWWQALPLGPTGYGDSPYQSSVVVRRQRAADQPGRPDRRRAVAGALTARATRSRQRAVEYEKVVPFKLRLLETAWSRFSAGARPDLRPAYEQFCQDHGLWLDDYALFRALKARYDGATLPRLAGRAGPARAARP